MSIGEKRLLAAIFDYVVIVILSHFLAYFLSFGNTNSFIYDYIGIIFLILSVIYKDSLFASGSIGKKIFGLAIYDKKTNKYANNKIKIKRNLTIYKDLPLILFKIENNPVRYCDAKYGTKIDYIKK